MPKVNNVEDLLLFEIRDLYDTEHRIASALPKMATMASHPQLKAAFEMHLEQTEGQIRRLEQVFKLLGQPPKKKTCEGIKGIIAEGQEVLKMDMEPHVKDAALIGAAQRVEHYEIAGYGCARTFASLIGNSAAADLLQETLDEEIDTDEKLTQLAEVAVNPQALQV